MDTSEARTPEEEIMRLNATIIEQGNRIVAALLAASVTRDSAAINSDEREELFLRILKDVKSW